MDNNSFQEYPDAISDELIAAFLDGNVSGEEMEAVAAALADDAYLDEIISLSPVIDREVEQEQMSILPMNALAAANPDCLCSFHCERYVLDSFGLEADHWSLLETAKANNWVREEGTPLHHVGRLLEMKGLHVERRYDADENDILKALRNGKQVIAIVDKNVLWHTEPETSSPAFHALSIFSIDMQAHKGTVVCCSPDDGDMLSFNWDVFDKAWKKSGCYMVAVSKSSAVYDPKPIDVSDIPLNTGLEELTEAIAENAHDIWARARMDEGWTYGSVRDDVRKLHPDLVPYAKLTETEKEYDRIMAMNTLRLVRRLGFDILPRT